MEMQLEHVVTCTDCTAQSITTPLQIHHVLLHD